MRSQLGTTVSQRTIEQARELQRTYGWSLRDLLTIAIDRIYQMDLEEMIEWTESEDDSDDHA